MNWGRGLSPAVTLLIHVWTIDLTRFRMMGVSVMGACCGRCWRSDVLGRDSTSPSNREAYCQAREARVLFSFSASSARARSACTASSDLSWAAQLQVCSIAAILITYEDSLLPRR